MARWWCPYSSTAPTSWHRESKELQLREGAVASPLITAWILCLWRRPTDGGGHHTGGLTQKFKEKKHTQKVIFTVVVAVIYGPNVPFELSSKCLPALVFLRADY